MLQKTILLLSITAYLQLVACENWDSQLIAQFGNVDESSVETLHNKIQDAIAELNNRVNDIKNRLEQYKQYEGNLHASFLDWVYWERKSLKERGDNVEEEGVKMINEFQSSVEKIQSCNVNDVQTSTQEYEARVDAHIMYYQTFMADLMQRVEYCQEKPYLDCKLVVRSELDALKQGPKDLYRVNADGASLVLMKFELRMCIVQVLSQKEAKFQELIEKLRNLSL